MRVNPLQIVLASVLILGAAGLSEVLRPRQLLASTQRAPDLEHAIPKEFGRWRLVPNVGVVTPGDAGAYVQRELSERIYSQEVTRAYADPAGNVVMFLVAYGPVQIYRLKSASARSLLRRSRLQGICQNNRADQLSDRFVPPHRQPPGCTKRASI